VNIAVRNLNPEGTRAANGNNIVQDNVDIRDGESFILNSRRLELNGKGTTQTNTMPEHQYGGLPKRENYQSLLNANDAQSLQNYMLIT
jgi:hypothetical protein